MIIPEGVDQYEFRRKLQKGKKRKMERGDDITIQSKYKGVVMKLVQNRPFWVTENTKDRRKSDKFPFTEAGELAAYRSYMNHIVNFSGKKFDSVKASKRILKRK
jgi:hypothetical protein